MNEWTEYCQSPEWPAGDNLKWEVRLNRAWTETDTPFDDWDTGLRVRYCEREPERVKVIFMSKGQYSVSGNVAEEWVRLAAPIAAYHKGMRYMAMDENGFIHVYKNEPDNSNYPHEWHTAGEYKLIAHIPKEAMPADWKTAIVELVHEEPGDE
jgi:hypothetical protein